MAIIQPKNKRDYVNDEAYYEQFIIEPLKRNCPSVFEGATIPEFKVIIVNDGLKSTIQIKEGDYVPKQDAGIKEGFEFEGWFVSGTDEEWDFSNPIHGDFEIYAKWKKDEDVSPIPKEGYQYTIFGKEYRAGSREQGKLMYDAFEALTSRYPEYAEQLTQRTSVAKAIDVKKANTKDADPTYFRGCKSFDIEGEKYLVGTSYGYNAKISEIKGMFKICGVPLSEFVLDGKPIGPDIGSETGDSAESVLWEYKTKGNCSRLKWNGETTGANAVITVLQGSVAATPSQNFERSCKPAFTLKTALEAKGIIQNGTFMKDYTYDKVSTMINLLNGGSVSTPAEVRCGHLSKIDNQTSNTVKEAGSNIGGKDEDDVIENEGNDINGDGSEISETVGFEYLLWGVSHTAKKMSDMMHDVFDLIAEKYPEKIPELASSDSISSVARKEDVDGRKLPSSKLNYFRSSREHTIGDEVYYVGTSYNRSQGIGQLERMLKLCEGSSDEFKISLSPDRVSHSGGMTGKKGLSENDMEYIVNNGKKD